MGDTMTALLVGPSAKTFEDHCCRDLFRVVVEKRGNHRNCHVLIYRKQKEDLTILADTIYIVFPIASLLFEEHSLQLIGREWGKRRIANQPSFRFANLICKQ